MDKILYSGDQDPLLDALDGVVGTFFESGKQVKSAASSVFSKKLMEAHMPDDKHFAVHYIAIGGDSRYGANKNGDAWPEAGLAHNTGKYGMHTFVKNGHYFREHRNRDPKQAIGTIRAAAFNPEMHRGEVIVWGNKEKAAKEYARAKAGKTLTCSMSARVPGDVCSCCGNFAKSSAVYCTHLKNHMLQWMPKFSKFAYAINDEPNFFDLSDVENRADRIAVQLETMFSPTEKSASVDFAGFKFSDMQAKEAGIILPDSTVGCIRSDYSQILNKLIPVEEYLEALNSKSASVPDDARSQFVKTACKHAFNPANVDDSHLEAMRKVDTAVLFDFFAKRATLMPFNVFFAYTGNKTLKETAEDPAFKYASVHCLSRVFRDLANSPADAELEETFNVASSTRRAAFPIEDNAESTLEKFCSEFNVKLANVRSRALYNSVEDFERPEVSVIDITDETVKKAKVIAKAYAMYKIAFVNAALDQGQEIIDDATLLLINSNHT